jgi:hypothetical protein
MIQLEETNKSILESDPVMLDESLALIDHKDKLPLLH